EQYALGEQLSAYSQPACAECTANRHLLLPRDRSRKQEIGEIRARNQQHKPDGAQQNPQERVYIFHRIVFDVDDARDHLHLAVDIRILLVHGFGDRIDIGLGLLNRDSRFQAANHAVLKVTSTNLLLLVSEGQRNPQLGGFGKRRPRVRKLKSRRHHTDNRERLVVEPYDFPGDVRIGTEVSLPQSVAEYHNVLIARLILFG